MYTRCFRSRKQNVVRPAKQRQCRNTMSFQRLPRCTRSGANPHVGCDSSHHFACASQSQPTCNVVPHLRIDGWQRLSVGQALASCPLPPYSQTGPPVSCIATHESRAIDLPTKKAPNCRPSNKLPLLVVPSTSPGKKQSAPRPADAANQTMRKAQAPGSEHVP